MSATAPGGRGPTATGAIRIATGNDLASGAVVWWTGTAWSPHITEAVDVGPEGAALIAAEEAARRVNVPYLVDATATPQGPRPNHIKDRIRAAGPTVHPALAIHPELPVTAAPATHQSVPDPRAEARAD